MFVEYSLQYFWFRGFQRLQKDFSPILIHFVGQNVPAWLQRVPALRQFHDLQKNRVMQNLL